MPKLSKIPPPIEVVCTYARHNWLQPVTRRPFLPTTLVIYVTYRCNSRCVMCGIWEHLASIDAIQELAVSELDRMLADRLFTNIQHLNINGGEPTLRDDLTDLVQLAVERLPRLRWITMSSNGLLPERLIAQVERIAALCAQKNISFSLGLSVHGVAEVAERVFGIVGAFERQVQALTALQAMAGNGKLGLTLHCVITSTNALRLPELRQWCRERGVSISFALGEVRDRFLNQGKAGQASISEAMVPAVSRFLREMSYDRRLLNPSAFRYHHLANMLQYGYRRTISCHYAMGGVILGSQGEIYYCPHSQVLGNCRERSAYEIYYDGRSLDYRNSDLLRSECKECPPYTFNRQELEKDILKYTRFLLAFPKRSGEESRQGSSLKEETVG